MPMNRAMTDSPPHAAATTRSDPQASGARAPDPGSPTTRLLAILAAIVCAGAAILWQNTPIERQYELVGQAPPVSRSEAVIDPVSQVGLMGRVYIRLGALYDSLGTPIGPMAMPVIDASALTPAERIAAGIAAGVLLDDEAAIERIEREREALLALDVDAMDEQEQTRHVDLLLDTKHLLAIYRGEGGFVSDEARDRLVRRYRYFGELATTHTLPDEDPARAHLLSGGTAIIVFFLAIGAGAFIIFFTGLIVLLVGWTRLAGGRLRMAFRPPAPGGSVFLEVYALFVACFLAYAVLTTALDVTGLVSLAIQWGLLLVPFWPLLRGMNGKQWRESIGLHRGRGVFREIGAGLVAYLASVPLFVLGVLMTLVLMLLYALVMEALQRPEPAPPTNPIIEIVEQSGPFALVMIFLLASVWAPLTEELVFRGALHRALRTRLGWVAAALVGALLFAFMHGYGPLFVSPLVALGFMFAFMREWRGSLIASITAHFTHNTAILLIVGTMIYLVF